MHSELKKNTVFKQLFDVYSRFYVIILSALMILFSIILNVFIINTNSLSVSKALERSTNNVTYKLQQIVNLAWSLAKEESVERGVEDFLAGDAYKKIDSNAYLEDLFYSYWKSNTEISDIRVFFVGEVLGFGRRYSTVDFVELYDEEWRKYFQPNSGVIVTACTYNNKMSDGNMPDSSKLAIITPINIKNRTVAFLNIDIDKKSLFTKYTEDIEYADCSSILVSYDDEIIYNDERIFGSGQDPEYNSIYTEENIKDTIRVNGKTYSVFAAEPTVHGFTVIQLFPKDKITSHVLPIFLVLALMAAVVLHFTMMYSRKRAKQFVKPLIELEHAMMESKIIEADGSQAVEIQNIFESYNNLLQTNKKMIEDVKISDKKQKDSEIKALLAQISPHFLYNTLNVIVFKAINANQMEISTLVSKLAKLCRTRYNFTSEFIPLSEEVEHIEYYMQLQKECFKNKFDYVICIDDAFLEFYVPRFILQPIVENSILHGFSEISKNGRILVNACADEDLAIEITDNGNGIDNDIITKLNNNSYKTEKYGLRNINQRIKLLCGEQYGLTFSSNGHSRTTVKILLPIKFDF